MPISSSSLPSPPAHFSDGTRLVCCSQHPPEPRRAVCALLKTCNQLHRSTQPIMTLADFVAGDSSATGASSPRGRAGPIPRLLLVDDDEEAVAAQVAALATADLAVHPAAHVCVVCVTAASAQRLHVRLASLLAAAGFPVRHGYRDAFAFAPGLTI